MHCFIHICMDLLYAGCITRNWCKSSGQVHCSYMHWCSYLELIAILKLNDDCFQAYNGTFVVDYIFLLKVYSFFALLHAWACILTVALFALTI